MKTHIFVFDSGFSFFCILYLSLVAEAVSMPKGGRGSDCRGKMDV